MSGAPAQMATMRRYAWRVFDRDLHELSVDEKWALIAAVEAECIAVEAHLDGLLRDAARYDKMMAAALIEAEEWANGGDRR